MPGMLPLQPIRAILAQNSPFHISDDAVREIRDFLDTIASDICKQSVQEFTKYNKNREIQGLGIKKRLDAHAVERAIPLVTDNIYKRLFHNNMGLQPVEVIVNPGGTTMPLGKSTATPDTATNDPWEVE